MQAFDRTNLRLLRDDLDLALKTVADKHGLGYKLGNFRFSPDLAKIPLELTASSNGKAENPDAVAFKTYARMFGLEPTDLGRTFQSHGQTFTITGIKPRSSKFPVLAKRADGKGYKFPAEDVALFLKRG